MEASQFLTNDYLPVLDCTQPSSILSSLKTQQEQFDILIKSTEISDNDKQNVMKEKITIQKNSNNLLAYIVCNLCPFLCLDERQINTHIQEQHKNKKPRIISVLKCPACNNQFYHKLSLRSHLRYDHYVTDNEAMSKIVKVTSDNKQTLTYFNSVVSNGVNIIIEDNGVKNLKRTSQEHLKSENNKSNETNRNNLNDNFETTYENNDLGIAEHDIIAKDLLLNDIVSHDQQSIPRIQLKLFRSLIENSNVAPTEAIEHISNVPDSESKNYLLLDTIETAKIDNVVPTSARSIDNSDKSKALKTSAKPAKYNILCCTINNCKKSFSNRQKFDYHIKCHDNDNFKCPECELKFNVWKIMSSHLWRLHKLDIDLYSCDLCSYKTYSWGHLMSTHVPIHGTLKAVVCDVCKKCFKNTRQMRNHRRTVHNTHGIKLDVHGRKQEKSNFVCTECDKAFKSKRRLQMHTDCVHKKLKPFLCTVCGYKGSTKNSLKQHMRLHTGEKPYVCDKCDYKSGDHNTLRRHKLRHSDDRPYKCSYCDYSSIQSSTYKVHLKTKHPGLEEELVFSCTQCQYRTINKDMFQQHVSLHINV